MSAATGELTAAQGLVTGLRESERRLQVERDRLVARVAEMERKLGFAQVRNQELSGRLQEIWTEPTWLLLTRFYEIDGGTLVAANTSGSATTVTVKSLAVFAVMTKALRFRPTTRAFSSRGSGKLMKLDS